MSTGEHPSYDICPVATSKKLQFARCIHAFPDLARLCSSSIGIVTVKVPGRVTETPASKMLRLASMVPSMTVPNSSTKSGRISSPRMMFCSAEPSVAGRANEAMLPSVSPPEAVDRVDVKAEWFAYTPEKMAGSSPSTNSETRLAITMLTIDRVRLIQSVASAPVIFISDPQTLVDEDAMDEARISTTFVTNSSEA
eukprot:923572-Rhodomonas_salina.1